MFTFIVIHHHKLPRQQLAYNVRTHTQILKQVGIMSHCYPDLDQV